MTKKKLLNQSAFHRATVCMIQSCSCNIEHVETTEMSASSAGAARSSRRCAQSSVYRIHISQDRRNAGLARHPRAPFRVWLTHNTGRPLCTGHHWKGFRLADHQYVPYKVGSLGMNIAPATICAHHLRDWSIVASVHLIIEATGCSTLSVGKAVFARASALASAASFHGCDCKADQRAHGKRGVVRIRPVSTGSKSQ